MHLLVEEVPVPPTGGLRAEERGVGVPQQSIGGRFAVGHGDPDGRTGDDPVTVHQHFPADDGG